MAFLIEKLVGNPVIRKDEKRLTTILRPPPARPRDVFEQIGAQGREPTLEGLLRGIQHGGADPRDITFAFLGRWPTGAELAALPTPYRVGAHIRSLVQSKEFRRTFVRRIFDAFPERKRLIHIAIPRSGTDYILKSAPIEHPVLDPAIADAVNVQTVELFKRLGPMLYRLPVANTLMVSVPRLPEFVSLQPETVGLLGAHLPVPLYRPTDLLFAVVRDPEEILLSQAHAILAALQNSAAAADPKMRRWRERVGVPPAPTDKRGARDCVRRILADLDLRNPICTALGDGTAGHAIEVCRVSRISLIGMERLTEWARGNVCADPDFDVTRTPFVLKADDLSESERSALHARLEEDRIFYAHFRTAFEASETVAVSGKAL